MPAKKKAAKKSPKRSSIHRSYKPVAYLRSPVRSGAREGRHEHLDLRSAQKMMSARDYNFFVGFVGAEALGFKEEDFREL